MYRLSKTIPKFKKKKERKKERKRSTLGNDRQFLFDFLFRFGFEFLCGILWDIVGSSEPVRDTFPPLRFVVKEK